MRFYGKKIDFKELIEKLDGNIAIDKLQLRIYIESLPAEKKAIVKSRIKSLEIIDKKANFFNATAKDVHNHEVMEPDKYFDFITDDEIFDDVPIEMIAQLLLNTRLGKDYLSLIIGYKKAYGDDILKYIMRQDNPLDVISGLYKYPGRFLDNFSGLYHQCINNNPEVDKDKLFKNIINMDSTKMPLLFRQTIHSGEDLLNIESCFRSSVDLNSFSVKNYSDKDSLCIYLYGIDYMDVQNIVNKYGNDLEYFKSADSDMIYKIMELNPNNYQKVIALYPTISMLGLTDKEIASIDDKRIEELSNIHEVFSRINEMKSIINALDDPNTDYNKLIDYIKERAKGQPFITYSSFQRQIINIFENEYNRVLYNPVKDAIKLDDLSDEFGVDVYEVDYNRLDILKPLVRIENAYHKNIFKAKEERYKVNENLRYDGLPTSFCDSENFKLSSNGIVRDVITGYTSINRLQNMAPWDFVSQKSIKDDLVPEGEPFYRSPTGIEFHFPNRLLDKARLGTTELTMYKNTFDGEKFNKVIPDYYYYEIGDKYNPKNPKSIERALDEIPNIYRNNMQYINWYMTVQDARYTGKPILLVNTQKLLDIGKQKTTDLKEKFISSTDTQQKIQLLEHIISTYEKCSNSMNLENTHGEYLKSDLFGYANRDNFYDSLYKHIEEVLQLNPEQGKELLQAYKGICEKELAKLTTSTMCRGNGVVGGRNRQYFIDNYHLENTLIKQLDKISILEAKSINGEYSIFTPTESLLDLMKAIRQPIGKEPHYNVPGAIHGVEHADKVVLLGDAIAQREGLSDKDRKLVNIACLLHDWKRVDNNSGSNHGLQGAYLLIKEFKKGNLAFLGLSKEDIPMLSTAICYHSYSSDPFDPQYYKRHNIINHEAIWSMVKEFGIDTLKLSSQQKKDYMMRTEKLCSILKDADNLDRFRFTKDNYVERPMYGYLHTDAAKSPELRVYANFLNQSYARMVLQKNYPSELLEEDEKTDYVGVLNKVRSFLNNPSGRNLGQNYAENHEIQIPLEELWDKLYSLNPRIKVSKPISKPIQKDHLLDSAIEASKEVVTTNGINKAIESIRNFFNNLFHEDPDDTR